MRKLFFLFWALSAGAAFAQTAQNKSLGGQPIEITSTGGTNYDNGLATAVDNVAIHIGDTDIYGDRATYNTETHEVHVEGSVRIYRGAVGKHPAELYVGENGTYNTEKKTITADDMRTTNYPYLLGGEHINSIGEDAKLVLHGIFTTHDSSQPDFTLRARRVRVYEGDRIIMRDVVFYVGKIPIFYWPYLYQSLDDSFSFLISPAYLSSWGPSILSRLTFPITKDITGTARLDLRGRRGIAFGFDSSIEYGEKKSSSAKLRTYFLRDQNPFINRTALPRGSIPTDRFRLSLTDRTRITDEITGTVNVTRLSDPFILQDFFPSEFRVNPQPDNLVAVTKVNPLYTLTAYSRFQLNDFYEATERLPEIALDVKRQPVFGSPIFYEGETSFGSLRRSFGTSQTLNGSELRNYEALRFDSFHQFVYPKTYLGWLSVVPRVGFRGTWYSESRDVSQTIFTPSTDPLIPDFLIPPPTDAQPLRPGGDRFRTVMNAGFEASFKFSRVWEGAQSRALGLDGLRHIVQPFVNFSYVDGTNNDPAQILQFDRYQPSTQLRPLDFPQFTSIDSIDNWTIARLGVRNRLQTRRDDATINWLELQTYFDINIDNPYDRNSFSNLYNKLLFAPVPWAGLSISSQLPLVPEGFTEINTDVHFQPVANVALSLGHRYLRDSPFFPNSSLYTASAYYRLNDNWALGASGRYEGATGYFEEQRYSVYRDLTSWVASLGAIVRDNAGVKEYGVLVTFTLKALPKFSFDLNFDPGAQGGQGTDNTSGVGGF
ncbi:MAG: LPS-assembly protein LptD [Chthoniobacterales bacterium]